MLGWCLNELSARLTIPKVLTSWPELAGTLGEGRCTQQVVAGREETEERSAEGGHLEGEAACGEEAGTEEGVAQIQRLELWVVTGLALAVIFRCGVVHGLYFCRNKFQGIIPSN